MAKCINVLLQATLAIIIGALLQCEKREMAISGDRLQILKSKYDRAIINYFYEIVYYQDYVGSKDFLSKWDDEISISMEGELWQNDSLYIDNVVNQIKELQIPINVHLTCDTAAANLRVYFGSFEYLEKKLGLKDYPTFRGVGDLSVDNARIKSARIGISNNSKAYSKMASSKDTAVVRQGIIFQEIIQSLGATGDSWLHYESLFFEGINKSSTLHEIDKQLIRLLYEPALMPNYSRAQFEKDFADVLYTVGAKQRLVKYVKAKQVPISYLKSINRYCITDSAIVKFPYKIFLNLHGTYDKVDSTFCRRVATEFNKISNHFQLAVGVSDIYSNPCINIHFFRTQSDTASVTGKMSVLHTKQMLRRRVIGDIKIWHPNTQSTRKRLNKNKSIVKSIYRILAFNHIEEEVAIVDSLNNITLLPEYRAMLAFFYNPVIPTGFTKKEMEEVIKELEKQN